VTIEVGGRTLTAKAAVLREGPERDRLYARLTEYWPDFLQYETRTTRGFPGWRQFRPFRGHVQGEAAIMCP
jgi:hypothetical protein